MQNDKTSPQKLRGKFGDKTIKDKKGVAIKLCLAILGMLVLINAIISFTEADLTIGVAEIGFLEDSISLDGYIFREQELIISPVGGVFEPIVADGERVGRGERVAIVYVGSLPAEVLDELRLINDRIARSMTNTNRGDLFARDPVALERQIADSASAIIEAAYLRDGERLAGARQSIDELIVSRNLLLGGMQEESDTIARLEQERSQIEARHGVIRTDLFAPKAGMFISNLDGLEEHLQISEISGLMPEDIDRFDEIPVTRSAEMVPGQAVSKIVDNLHWYFVAVVDTVRIHPLQVRNTANPTEANRIASTVWLRFFDIADTRIEGTVAHISQDIGGRSVIAISARGHVGSAYASSRVSVDLVRRMHRGLRVETDAIRVLDDGRTGVFIVRNNLAMFREVRVLHNTPEWSIIYQDTNYRNQGNVVRLFDEVIVSRRDITDGMMVR